MNRRNRVRAGVLATIVISLAAGFAAVGPFARGAEAKPMLSGQWDITLSGDVAETCTAVIDQPDQTIKMALDCSSTGVQDLAGEIIDPAAGTFAVASESFLMEGEAVDHDSGSLLAESSRA